MFGSCDSSNNPPPPAPTRIITHLGWFFCTTKPANLRSMVYMWITDSGFIYCLTIYKLYDYGLDKLFTISAPQFSYL